MIPLPLLLEPTAHCLLVALPLSGSLFALAAYVVWRARQAGWAQFRLPQWLACGAMVTMGVTLIVQPIGWRLIFDREGISLRAPFDPFADTGAIPWIELQSVRFGSTGGRTAQTTVEFAGRPGHVLVLKVPEGVPDAFWPAMISVVEANAPQFQFHPNADGWLAEVRSLVQRQSGTFAWEYAAHDGEGREIK